MRATHLASTLPALTLAICCAFGPPVGAQHHATGWVFAGRPMVGSGALAGVVDPTGSRAVTLFAGEPSTRLVHDVVMDLDNRSYVVTVQEWGKPSHLLEIDAVGGIVGTLAALRDAYGSEPGGRLLGLTPDPEGGFFGILAPGAWGGEPGVVRCNRTTGVIATLHTGAPFRDPVALIPDLETGDLIVLDRAGYLFRVRPSGGAVTTLAALPFAVGFGVTRLAATGDLFVPARCPSAATGAGPILRVSPTGSVQMIPHPGFFCADGVCVDRASARVPRLTVAASSAVPGMTCTGLVSFDPGNAAAAAISCWSHYHYRTLRPNRGRHLATRRISAHAWEIRLSFPGEAGDGYTLVLSMSGTLPGCDLPDRRHLAINPDVLSFLAATGQLFPHLRGAAGRLDANAEARAILDAGAFPALAGRRIWALAVSHDAGASYRIRTIPDPVLLIL